MTENINPTIIERAIPNTDLDSYDCFLSYVELFDPLFPDDQREISKDYYIEPFRENPVLNQIPEIRKSLEYFLLYRIGHNEDELAFPKKPHAFVPCRYANLKPAGYLPGPDINQGWQKTDDGLYKRTGSLDYDIQGMRIKDNTLYLEREGSYPDNHIKVIAVPGDIKKPSREKWLKAVAYTLISDPDNIG